MAIVLIGTLMAVLDTTIVSVALPQIGVDLHQSSEIEWIVTAYLLAGGIALPATGWLADRMGRKQIFTVCVGLFALSSLFSALSPNLPALLAFRTLQGAAGAALFPVGLAMIFELFPPHRRGTALGVWGVASMAGPAMGPVLGGFIVTAVSWRWLFIINVPIGAIAVVLAARFLRDYGFRERRRFDLLGLLFAGAGLVGLLLAFSEVGTWGWASTATIVSLALGVVFVALFGVHALRVREPLIELRIFRSVTFDLTIAINGLLIIMQFGRLVFIPIELETLRHVTPLEVGVILTPTAFAAGLMNLLGGRLTDRIGPRLPVMAGILLVAVPGWFLTQLTPASSILLITIVLAAQGLGNGISMTPSLVAGMNALESRFVAQASAVRSLNQRVWGALATGILASVVAAQIGSVSDAGLHVSTVLAQHAYNSVFVVGLVVLIPAFVIAFFLPGRESTRRDQAARAVEQEELKTSGMLGPQGIDGIG
jgi:EmrB/QacA subfamily drug resistance transporter